MFHSSSRFFYFILSGLIISTSSFGLGARQPRQPAKLPSPTTPLILVHGLYMENKNSLSAVRNALINRGYNAGLIFTFNMSNSTNCVEVSAGELASYVQSIRSSTGASKVNLLTHSLGGLVARHYLKYLSGAERVERLVAISAPNHGTNSAIILGGAGCSITQGKVNSDYLNALNHPAEVIAPVRTAALIANLDAIIVPASSSNLSGAENKSFWANHFGILNNRDAQNFIIDKLMK